MASVNKVFIMGNLTRDVELKSLDSGSPLAEFGVAMNEKYKDKESVTFVDITVWGSLAENCSKYLSKGSPVFVEGKLNMDSWEDKTSGQKRTKLKVTGLNVQFLGKNEEKLSSEDIPF